MTSPHITLQSHPYPYSLVKKKYYLAYFNTETAQTEFVLFFMSLQYIIIIILMKKCVYYANDELLIVTFCTLNWIINCMLRHGIQAKAIPSYIFVSHKNAGRIWTIFQEKKKKIWFFLLLFLGSSEEIMTLFPQKISKMTFGSLVWLVG